MRKRLLLSLGLLACLFVGFVAVLWLTGPRHRINLESFEKIHVGMTQEEVEQILNCPPGDYGPGTGLPIWDKKWMMWSTRAVEKTWLAEEVGICVWLHDEKVASKEILSVFRFVDDSVLDKLRRWLGLPWW